MHSWLSVHGTRRKRMRAASSFLNLLACRAADKNPRGTERFKLVSEAFAVLSDRTARAEYDYNASNTRRTGAGRSSAFRDFPAGPTGPMGQSVQAAYEADTCC